MDCIKWTLYSVDGLCCLHWWLVAKLKWLLPASLATAESGLKSGRGGVLMYLAAWFPMFPYLRARVYGKSVEPVRGWNFVCCTCSQLRVYGSTDIGLHGGGD